MSEKVKIGTRDSDLAVCQANLFENTLKKVYPKAETQLVKIKAEGDRILDTSLENIGGKGLFIKELERALLDNEIDFAVHSMKDMPPEMPRGLILAGILERDDPRDALVVRKDILDKLIYSDNARAVLERLPKNSVIGTGSPRRRVQLRSMRDDIEIKPLRGNVKTRLRRLENGEFDAVVVSKAGLNRLNISGKNISAFSPEDMIPAAGQGIIGIEARIDSSKLWLAQPDFENCREGYHCLTAERAFTAEFGGNCKTPVGAFAKISNGRIHLIAFAGDEQKGRFERGHISGDVYSAHKLGYDLALQIKRRLGEQA